MPNCFHKLSFKWLTYLLLVPQVVEDGYEFFAKRQLVTLFSAPNYCGEFDNAGAMMSVDETLMCSFQVRSVARGSERISLGQEPAMFIFFPAQTAAMFEPEKNETAVAYCRLSSITSWYRVAYKAYPLNLSSPLTGVRAVTATASKTWEQWTKIADLLLFLSNLHHKKKNLR